MGDVTDDRPRVDITKAEDEVTRSQLLRRAAAGAIVLVYGGFGAKTAVAGAPNFRGKELKGTLKILQWSHFVPAYDGWFDNQYTKRWGQANDTDIIVDHVNQADLPARVAAEAAAGKGHDLVALLAPAPQYEDRVIDHKEIVQEVRHKRGKMADVCYRSAYNPKTKKFHGFPDFYAPDPVDYRTDLWGQVGLKPDTWDHVLKAAPKLRQMGHPVGIGMSNEIDSNMAMMALMMCFGSFIQSSKARVTLNSKATREALTFGRDLFRKGMSNEIFAWTAASNNQGMLAGRLSLALNAISIPRSAESTNPDLAKTIGLLPIPKGPHGRLGLEHVMHTYMIWKFAANKKMAVKFLVELEIKYRGAFEASKFYNFPSFPASVQNIPVRLGRDPHPPAGKYKILQTISQKYTKNVGYPGYSNAAIGEIFDTFLIPQMFAEVAQGKRTPDDAARDYQRRIGTVFEKWRKRGKI
ncbi:MAG: extracellular solute-binding protein [Actinobacteria bacterium]|nr:MAG: extracellular solute-binding protein [Actinomycetota bacterium]